MSIWRDKERKVKFSELKDSRYPYVEAMKTN